VRHPLQLRPGRKAFNRQRHQCTYDANGSLTGKATPGQTADYQYDSAGRLTNVCFDDGTYIGYGYDGFGRKVSRTEDYWHPEEGEKE